MSRKPPPPPAAVLVIDVLNDLAFPGGEKVVPWAHKMAARLKPFLARARAAGFPVIYVNDNYDHWRSDHGEIYRYCTRKGARGRAVVRKLKPRRDDYFIVKPKHSGFFGTSLQPLLQHLGARRLILTGMATNLCVFFTAHDAHMHEYDLYALSDCCAAESDFDHDTALDQLKRFCGVTVMRSDEVDFEAETPAAPEEKDKRRGEAAGKPEKATNAR
ncbi:cysteine hydrolase family protein [Chondromyces apiculatus]|uniref:Isochorismatase hydrolase n=1 Tax=Chondromyces apiculatus DSM 436 TaxID=1192034 RepID=A0A017SUA5_9BACT|nr:isochorismatase family cysteine hydrolase [Chondromyces apiculatus]EYF00372.1 isochorismatase hydrolase [Chondromyces apiculatus DSM 436]